MSNYSESNKSKKKRYKHHKNRKQRRYRFVIVNPLRLLLSIAIFVMIIVICCQLCSRGCNESPSVKQEVKLISNELNDSAIALGHCHAIEFKSLHPDTSAMADYLLETRARATDFRNRYGTEVEQLYVSTFEKESGILRLQ